MTLNERIGSNIELLASQKFNSLKEFAATSHYCTKDMGRLYDGRLSLAPRNLNDIAQILGVDTEELLREPDFRLECMGYFEEEANRITVMNLINTYVDLAEEIDK